jgi:predicted membrane-bound mannosyltransferase
VFIPVVTPVEDAWPLPWYLRRYPQVGYWLHPSQLPALPESPPFLVATPEFEDGIRSILGENYISEYYGLRPDQGVFLTLYVRKDLWDRFMATRQSIGGKP